MFGISGTELFIIVAFALLIFGPDKLPEYGRTAGKFWREFKRAQENMESMIKAEMYGESPSVQKPSGPTQIVAPEDDEEEEEEEE